MRSLSEILPPTILDTIFAVRAPLVRLIKPKKSYFLFPVTPEKNVEPLSYKFGFDRGTPITRYYIEKFLNSNKTYIKGRVLEIHDSKYTKKYGGKNVTQADALDIDTGNRLANIFGDLRNLRNVKTGTYDCLIVTQTFGMIDDYEAAVKECHRILKKGGVLLGTAVSMGPMGNPKYSYWRFTAAAVKFVFGRHFGDRGLFIQSYGNALAGQASWVGIAREELKDDELDYHDSRFPLLIGFRAKK